ncbi:Hydroxymethylglutaryl-coenzyme A reductase [Streptomyces sp. YIM 130001]|uniref:hydroxymethylglutaryl-CoA reductase n=1 Tax=Streptomyces sp. YIM 130001 TaxID=2259644 RepID=UPI000E657C98|nr:hydroxymethylglutaryl-CoA reductase [Streptomyces sp. YIM 130001]RII11162.1 Hydroxymethylglutaryl-coenzyme A reductase [Streptomyces sp. YIM 130001]
MASHETQIPEHTQVPAQPHSPAPPTPADLAARRRREALEQKHRVALPAIGHHTTSLERARCENLIGAVQVPVGVAGPLTLHGRYVRGEDVIIPLATTEGALIASVSRGCRALRESGGATVLAEDVGITRAPVFATSGISDSRRLTSWIEAHEAELRQEAQAVSQRLRLTGIRCQAVGSSVYVRFTFTTGDAMGMNLATVATERLVHGVIEPATGTHCVALSGNYCTDKKASAVNLLDGRGKRVFAEAEIPAAVLSEVLKTDTERLCEVQYRKNLLGSAMSGTLGGFNAHYANMVAALFLATGQDVAQVAEACQGITCVERRGEGVYASVYLPDVPLATAGGGTVLETQQEALHLLGIDAATPTPEGHAALRLAEVLGGAVLAGELSLLAALASGALASAHEHLGRPVTPRATGLGPEGSRRDDAPRPSAESESSTHASPNTGRTSPTPGAWPG